MTNFRLIGAAAVLLLVATPAMAKERHHHHVHASRMLASPAPAFDYGSAYGAYDFDPGENAAPGNIYDDFARRNTFN